jgi:uncharacterized ion transporter superfamily protein YfcC
MTQVIACTLANISLADTFPFKLLALVVSIALCIKYLYKTLY